MMTLCIIVGLFVRPACASLLAPSRLRADGSDWSSSAPHARFALPASHAPTFTWEPRHLQRRHAIQSGFEVNVSDTKGQLVWSSGRVVSSEPSVRYGGTDHLASKATYIWMVATYDGVGRRSPTSKPSSFHIAPSTVDWEGVDWLGSNTTNVYRASILLPASAATELASAVLYVCGLGFSVASLDGQVLNTLTTAPWTNNGRVNGFSSIDVTKHLLRARAHAATPTDAPNHLASTLEVSLGHGWRNLSVRDPSLSSYGATPRVLRAMVVITFANGTSAKLCRTGDASWSTAAGPSLEDSLYNGETYDGRVAQRLGLGRASWSMDLEATGSAKGGSAIGWSVPVKLSADEAPKGMMVAWSAPPIIELDTLSPHSISTPRPQLYVVDFGVNKAGVCRLRLKRCPRGARLILRHAEIMQHNGLPDLHDAADPTMIYTGNLRSAKATDTYICSGEEVEVWQPRLTYHGFRFAEINTSLAQGVTVDTTSVGMVLMGSAVPSRSNASFSNPTLNRMQRMALGAQQSNLMSLPTDCDQRDERLGWMGDAALSAEAMAINFDLGPFWRWWLTHEAMAEMGTDGSLPDVVPFVRFGGRPGDVAWSAALPSVAYALWMQYGDLSGYVKDGVGEAISEHLANVAVQAKAGLDQMHTP